MKISASLVLFNNPENIFSNAIKSFIEASDGILYVVDNSPSPIVSDWFKHSRVVYHFSGKNLGFGCAHNLAFFGNNLNSDFHIFINPDIVFDTNVIKNLLNYISDNNNVGVVMPKITYLNGEPQYLCKLLPTPFDLILRRFIPLYLKRFLGKNLYELKNLPDDKPSEVPSISGCFLLIRSSIFNEVGGFDPRYFMYMEDIDLIRRVNDLAKVIYHPGITVRHAYAKQSYGFNRLFLIHIISAIKYFFKWGWFIDSTRSFRNKKILESFKK